MNFCQKLTILQQFYENKQIPYFHMGYTLIRKSAEIINFEFLTKIHKVGLVWSTTLMSNDRISKNTKFQYFIVVRVEKYGS